MSFIAIANPPAAQADTDVPNDPWFPAISSAAARARCRLDGTVSPERLRYALGTAMASVNEELAAYRQEQQLRWGYACLADVPAMEIDGRSVQVLRYERAVFECLQADLEEAYRNQDTLPNSTGKEARVLEALAINVDTHRRNMRWAISDILGIRRTTVDLI